MWAQPRHLATPGDQKFLKWGGERVASYISHPEVLGFFNQQKDLNDNTSQPPHNFHTLKWSKREVTPWMNLFLKIL